MWNDIETTDDLLNFSIVAQTAAQLIRDSNSAPLSIGVSGNWGTGKSSLVKMIGKELRENDFDDERFVFLEFNAWLYQGYDDARMALLQSVSDCLSAEAEKRQSGLDKALEFAKRINWLKVGKLLAPAATGVVLGGTIGGPLGAVVGAGYGLFHKGQFATEVDYQKVADACGTLGPKIADLLENKGASSMPKEIDGLRKTFEVLLTELDITLVVLVDDLDRCLPDTAISTLEAMRLLLFLPRTAFIIAADEEMIRNAVRHHFSGIMISDDLVRSYFDKLIQIPLRVPRLGHAEVKGYLILLFAEREMKKGELRNDDYAKAKEAILSSVKESWGSGLTKKAISEAFGGSSKMDPLINLADQIAGILTTAKQIAGNPRLIKRFLNELNIRKAIAEAEGLTLAYEELMKLQLFERCASAAAFEYLVLQAGMSEDGKPAFLSELESLIASDEKYEYPTESWNDSFIEQWMKLYPPLSGIDLRPILNLSRTQVSASVSYDKLSIQALDVLNAIFEGDDIEPILVDKLREIGEAESEQILVRLVSKARGEQLSTESILRAMNVTEAYPQLSEPIVALLSEIPPKARKAPFVIRLKEKPWANSTLAQWAADKDSPDSVKKAINLS